MLWRHGAAQRTSRSKRPPLLCARAHAPVCTRVLIVRCEHRLLLPIVARSARCSYKFAVTQCSDHVRLETHLGWARHGPRRRRWRCAVGTRTWRCRGFLLAACTSRSHASACGRAHGLCVPILQFTHAERKDACNQMRPCISHRTNWRCPSRSRWSPAVGTARNCDRVIGNRFRAERRGGYVIEQLLWFSPVCATGCGGCARTHMASRLSMAGSISACSRKL